MALTPNHVLHIRTSYIGNTQIGGKGREYGSRSNIYPAHRIENNFDLPNTLSLALPTRGIRWAYFHERSPPRRNNCIHWQIRSAGRKFFSAFGINCSYAIQSSFSTFSRPALGSLRRSVLDFHPMNTSSPHVCLSLGLRGPDFFLQCRSRPLSQLLRRLLKRLFGFP